MKKALLLLIAVACSAQWASAKRLTAEQAFQNAMSNSSTMQRIKGQAEDYHLEWEGKNGGLYVFGKKSGGFMVASGDDALPSVIGYSESASFESSCMPPALEALLKQIDLNVSLGKFPKKMRISSNREDIAPMIKSKWTQNSPYNDLCPDTKEGKTMTGCVATSSAMILKYWEYPLSGTGEVTYRWEEGRKTLTYDFESHPFDYASMTETYGETSTEKEKAAVAELMYACGVAANMQYSTEFSGATDFDAASAFINYLGFDRGLELVYRDFFTISDWNDMIYEELSCGRPVPYYGYSPAGGHAYVCDGYQNLNGEDYFHINWGWAGISDGYFLLNALDPEQVGLGATKSESGFNIMQSAIVGLQPATPQSADTPLYQNVSWFGYFGIGDYDYTRGDNILFGCTYGDMRGGFNNLSLETVNINIGVKLTPKNADGQPAYMELPGYAQLATGAYIDRWELSSTDFPEGEFIATPAFKYKDTDEWIDPPMERQLRTSMSITVKGDDIHIDIVNDSEELVLTEMVVYDPVHINGMPYKIGVKGYSHKLNERTTYTPVLLTSDYMIVASMTPWVVNAMDGTDYDYEWNEPFDTTLPPGTYYLGIMNNKLLLMFDPIEVAVLNEDTPTEFRVDNVRINRKSVTGNVTKVSADKVSFSYRILLSSGYFEGSEQLWLYDEEDNPIREVAPSKDLILFPGQSENYSVNFSMNEEAGGQTYSLGVRVAYSNGETEEIGNKYKIELKDTGVSTLDAANGESQACYNLNGTESVGGNLGKITIRRNGNQYEKVLQGK